MKPLVYLIGLLVALSGPAAGATDQLLDQVRAWRDQNAARITLQLRDFLRLPNVSADQEAVRKNAEFLRDRFQATGAQMQLLEVPGANPVVYGQRLAPGGDRTIVLYAHYDGQPVNPGRWTTGSPFEPTLYADAPAAGGRPIDWPAPDQRVDPRWRIYGRSASDDKAPLVALLAAFEALRQVGAEPTINLKFYFDGEEEIGSPNMARVLAEHGDKFSDADAWVFCDGPLHQSRQPTLYYGVRGIAGLEITVYGASRNLHSGHYGNWAPNPALQLAQLLASTKDSQGHVLIDGFYDDVVPLSESEKLALRQVPPVDDSLRRELGLVETENGNQDYLERMQLPSFNVRGLQSATVGRTARNIVPKEASASIDIRLVKGNRPTRMLQRVEAHLRKQGYHVLSGEPTAGDRQRYPRLVRLQRRPGYPAARTRMDDPQIAPLVGRVEQVVRHLQERGDARLLRLDPDDDLQLLQISSLGGSLPLYLITDGLRKPLVILPLANHDNNQHAPDENLRLGNLMYGIQVLAGLLTTPAER